MDDINRALDLRKSSFLDDIQNKVRDFIEGTGKQCIAVVEKDVNGDIWRTWECHFDDDIGRFCKVLFLFTRKKQYNGHDLDSALTEPISTIVESAYQDFYKSESDAISSGVLVMLAADDAKLVGFVDRITDIALNKLSSQVKKRVIHLVVDQVKQSVEQGTLHSIGQQIGHIAATTAGTQVATIVAHLLIKLMATNISHIVAKLLASAFIKKLIAIVVKKIILAVVTGAVLHFLAVQIGAAVGGSTLMWIVMPLLVAYIGYEIATFPEKLGKEVSKSVRKELDDRFESINKSIVEKIFEAVFSGNELVEAISKDEEFQTMMRKLAEKASS